MKWLRLVEVLIWAGLAVLLALNQSNLIVAMLTAIYGDPSQAPPLVLQNISFVSPLFPLLLGVVAWMRLATLRESLASLFGFSRQTAARDLLMGVAIGAGAIVMTVISLRISSAYWPMPPFSQMPAHFHIFFATVGAIIPGVFEEVYFRGLLFRVGKGLPKALLVVVSAIAFSLWHIGSPIYLPHTLLFGLILGSLYASTGRLAPAVIAHVTANAGFGLLLLSGFEIMAQAAPAAGG